MSQSKGKLSMRLYCVKGVVLEDSADLPQINCRCSVTQDSKDCHYLSRYLLHCWQSRQITDFQSSRLRRLQDYKLFFFFSKLLKEDYEHVFCGIFVTRNTLHGKSCINKSF